MNTERGNSAERSGNRTKIKREARRGEFFIWEMPVCSINAISNYCQVLNYVAVLSLCGSHPVRTLRAQITFSERSVPPFELNMFVPAHCCYLFPEF